MELLDSLYRSPDVCVHIISCLVCVLDCVLPGCSSLCRLSAATKCRRPVNKVGWEGGSIWWWAVPNSFDPWALRRNHHHHHHRRISIIVLLLHTHMADSRRPFDPLCTIGFACLPIKG